MTTGPQVIVCERKSRWAGVFRRDLSSANDRIKEVRGTAQARQMAEEHRGSLLLIELLADRIEEQLALVIQLIEADPKAVVISLGESKLGGLAAEAGAAAHFSTLHGSNLLADLVRRFLAIRPASVDITSHQDILTDWRKRLPWPNVASQTQDNP